jgi:hypothetical protein
MRAAFLATALVILPLDAAAGGRPVLAILGQLEDGPARLGAVHARLGQRVSLHLAVRVGRRWYTDARALQIGSRRIRPPLLQPLATLKTKSIAWSAVEPHPHHVKLPPPNPDNPAYSNAVLFGPNHGRWRGYDRIEYHETPLLKEVSGSLTLDRVAPSHPKVNVHGGLGTMRFKVSIVLDGRTLSTPGAEATGPRGLSPAVAQVSFREADDLVGWLTAYFNVPNVFGSGGDGATHQTELFQGADCADVIIGALRLAGARVAYTSVLGLRAYTRPVTSRLLLDETGIHEVASGGGRGQRVRLRFGDEVRRGDIMLIDYVGFTDSPRGWDHVAVVGRDLGKTGELDPEDVVLHMGYLYGLTAVPARSEGPALVQFLRLRPPLERRIAARARALAAPSR